MGNWGSTGRLSKHKLLASRHGTLEGGYPGRIGTYLCSTYANLLLLQDLSYRRSVSVHSQFLHDDQVGRLVHRLHCYHIAYLLSIPGYLRFQPANL